MAAPRFHGKTTMRLAFEAAGYQPKTRAGLYQSSGWKVARKPKGKKR